MLYYTHLPLYYQTKKIKNLQAIRTNIWRRSVNLNSKNRGGGVRTDDFLIGKGSGGGLDHTGVNER